MPSLFGFDVDDLTFDRILSIKAEKNGDRTFMTYIHDGRKFTYRDMDLISNRIANGLLAHGLGKGSHVAVMMENSADQVLAYFALGKIGAVAVPLNPAARGYFLEYFLNHSDSIAAFVDRHLVDQIDEILETVPRVGKMFVVSAHDAPITAFVGNLKIDYRQLLEYPDSRPNIPVRFSDPASIMYTSGTTGPSKGNVFTQAHTLTFAVGAGRAQGIGPDDIYYVSLPLFHASGWNTFTLATLLEDGEIAIPRHFSASRFLEDVRATGATVTSVAGMSHFLMAQPPSPRDRDHKLKFCIAAPMPADARAFEERFGVRLISAYGLTDFGMAFAFGSDDPASKYGSCGRAIDGISVRIVDDDDFEVRCGTPGEILLRQEQIWGSSSGYYKMPEATLAACKNLWFHTGDRGHVDEDGYVFFLDRKKDAIRRRGENISAFEVENAIKAHTAIEDVAVYPIRAEGNEDEVGVSVILKAGAVLEYEGFVEFCGRVLPYFMVPRFVEFRTELPRTLTQKLQKVKLREEMEKRLHLVWDREKAGIVFRRKAGSGSG